MGNVDVLDAVQYPCLLDLLDRTLWSEIPPTAYPDLYVAWDGLALARVGETHRIVLRKVLHWGESIGRTADALAFVEDVCIWEVLAALPDCWQVRIRREMAELCFAPVLTSLAPNWREVPRDVSPTWVPVGILPDAFPPGTLYKWDTGDLIDCAMWTDWAGCLYRFYLLCQADEPVQKENGWSGSICYTLDGLQGVVGSERHGNAALQGETWDDVLNQLRWVVCMGYLAWLQEGE